MTVWRSMLCIATLALACHLGCSEGNELSGSLDQVYRLDFSSVRARLYSSQLAIEYVAASEAVPVRITLRRRKGRRPSTGSHNLLKYGDITGELEDGNAIPRFSQGTLRLDEYADEQDALVVGDFDATFDLGRDTLSLSGHFDTNLDVVTDPGPPHE